MNFEQAWQSVLEQLQMEMPRASFETWVKDTHAVSLEDGVLIVTAPHNAYARDWLESRLKNTASRLLIGILNANVTLKFIVATEEDEAGEDESKSDEEEQKGFVAEPLDISRYRAEVHPDHIVMLDAYCLRLMEQGDMTAKELSLWVGFRQAVWRQWKQGRGTAKNTPHWEVMEFAMMSRASYFRELAHASEDTGRKFLAAGHVEIIPEVGSGASDRRMDNANRYRISMSPRLTRRDCAVLENLLTAEASLAASHDEARQTVLAALHSLAERDVMDWINQEAQPLPVWPRSVREIVQRVLGLEGDLSEEWIAACEKVQDRILGAFGKLTITHYFLRVVAPAMQFSHAQAWAIIALRDRCWYDHETQTQKEFVILRGGLRALARWVGNSVKSVSRWLEEPEFSAFVRFADMAAIQDAPEDWTQTGTQIVFVYPQEPLLGELFDGKPWTKRASDLDKVRLHPGQSETLPETSLDKVRLYPGQSETQVGTKRDSILDKMRLYLGQSETRLNNLIKPQLNLIKPQETPTSGSPAARVAVIPVHWVLDRLLSLNRVHPKTRKAVRGGDPKALISWMLYALSPQGGGIRNPISYALARLGEDPTCGAGGDFDNLAALPPSELIRVIHDGVRNMSLYGAAGAGGATGDLWLKAMGYGNERAVMLLSVLLGEDAPLVVEKIITQTTVKYV
jgi:hypothetical protein